MSNESKLRPQPNKEVADVPNIACDECGRTREIDMRWPHHEAYDPRPGDIIRGALVCSQCGGRSPFELREETITFKPGKQLVTPLNTGVPVSVRERYGEAEICLYAAAYRAAAVMGRSAVEQALVESGLTAGKLEDKIDKALAQSIIGQEQYALANGSRLIGNGAVHRAISVSPGEVPAVLSAAANIINHVF